MDMGDAFRLVARPALGAMAGSIGYQQLGVGGVDFPVLGQFNSMYTGAILGALTSLLSENLDRLESALGIPNLGLLSVSESLFTSAAVWVVLPGFHKGGVSMQTMAKFVGMGFLAENTARYLWENVFVQPLQPKEAKAKKVAKHGAPNRHVR